MAYAQQGRTQEVIREFQAALRVNPDDAVAHYVLGQAYEQVGLMDAARREARLALQLGYEPARELVARLGG